MACLAVALAVTAVELDKAVPDDWLQGLGWSYTGGADGASLLLATVSWVNNDNFSTKGEGIIYRCIGLI